MDHPIKGSGADYKLQNRRVLMLGGSFLLKRQNFSTDEKHMKFFLPVSETVTLFY